MRIAVIGPVYPYKGGIAHYTGAMSIALEKEHEVKIFSFSKLYPHLLYRHKQKEYDDKTFAFDNTEYILNSVNPISWYKTARQINRYLPDAVIVQWWHPWFTPCYWTVLRHINKKIKILFLCHNVFPHESFPMKKIISSMVLRKGEGFLVHSEQDENDLKGIIHNPKVIKAVIPRFNQFKKRGIDKQTARRELGIDSDQEMILFFGYIRRYKGVKHIIRALPAICRERSNAHLWIVGDFFENDKEEYLDLIKQTKCGDKLTLVDGYLPDDQVETYFAAADLCVFPYESATQSGVIQIAYGFECPVIATDVGGLPEAVTDGKTGYIVPALDDQVLAEKTIHFFRDQNANEFSDWIKAESEKYSWDRMAEYVDELINQVEK